MHTLRSTKVVSQEHTSLDHCQDYSFTTVTSMLHQASFPAALAQGEHPGDAIVVLLMTGGCIPDCCCIVPLDTGLFKAIGKWAVLHLFKAACIQHLEHNIVSRRRYQNPN